MSADGVYNEAVFSSLAAQASSSSPPSASVVSNTSTSKSSPQETEVPTEEGGVKQESAAVLETLIARRGAGIGPRVGVLQGRGKRPVRTPALLLGTSR